MKRGDLWWVELDAVGDNEILKARLCLIVSPEEMAGLGTVIVAPMVRQGQAASFRPAITLKEVSGVLVLDQIRAVETSRLKTRMGRIDDKSINAILMTLRAMFAV